MKGLEWTVQRIRESNFPMSSVQIEELFTGTFTRRQPKLYKRQPKTPREDLHRMQIKSNFLIRTKDLTPRPGPGPMSGNEHSIIFKMMELLKNEIVTLSQRERLNSLSMLFKEQLTTRQTLFALEELIELADEHSLEDRSVFETTLMLVRGILYQYENQSGERPK
jgi:hypothetical protein